MANAQSGPTADNNRQMIVALEPRLNTSDSQRASDSPRDRTILQDLQQLNAGFWKSPHARAIVASLIGVVVIIIANMVGQVWLNSWNGAFFDAIEVRDTAEIRRQLVNFLSIVSGLLVSVVAQTWLHETTKLRVREWLTTHLFDAWLIGGRPYRLGASGNAGSNPDQRMQEDARHLSELSTNLGIGLLHQLLLLTTFVGVLWQLSSDVVFDIGGVHVAIPGYMVWCAVCYALIGSLLTWLVGRRLVGLNSVRYAREAELRYRLVRVSERAEAVALYRGENGERRNLDIALGNVLDITRELIFALARLTWITSGYSWLAIVVPAVVALPGYLQGELTLGGLMVVIGAFNQVQQALRWFVDNTAGIADWRATLYRVAVFDHSLRTLDECGACLDQIHVGEHPQGNLAFENLTIQTAFGKVLIVNANEEIKRGERVLIVGDSGAGKSTLFRAISRLWPWGHGRILLPPREAMMFMPQHPYLPLGSLRMAVCYPDTSERFTDEQIQSALVRVELQELLPSLDVEERWDRVLSQGQQQLLAFARLLLHKSSWVFLDEATSALDMGSQANVMSIFEHEFKDATVVSIGHRPSLEQFHNRYLQLRVSPEGAQLSQRVLENAAKPPKSRMQSLLGTALRAVSGWVRS
jgi:vitamin B12/bleomycin/antimicrobial peptide transport system ATP-binding/permease protein